MPKPFEIGERAAVAFATATVFATLLGLFPQVATSAGPAGSAARSGVSSAFGVRGTHGYFLDVESENGVVTVVVSEGRAPVPTFSRAGVPRPAGRGNGSASIYRARVPTSDPRRIDVRLGRLGRIAVSFRPSGRTRVTRLGDRDGAACGRGLEVVRRLGDFVGVVEFQGEGGYTSVRAARASGSIGTPLPRGCAGASASSQRALLIATDRRSRTRFEARTAAGSARFLAVWQEGLGDGIVVSRRAYAGAPLSDFDLSADLDSARVTPPAPFTGSARFSGDGEGAGRWTGNLSATFPGVVIPMTGPAFRARLWALR